MDRSPTADERRTRTGRVAITFRKRGGRKQVVATEGADWSAPRPRVDNTMVRAIARAHRWKRLLESGRFASVTELAEAEKINQCYVCRVLRLTLLAPDLVTRVAPLIKTGRMRLMKRTHSAQLICLRQLHVLRSWSDHGPGRLKRSIV